jgi:hypothetical protein
MLAEHGFCHPNRRSGGGQAAVLDDLREIVQVI